VIANFPSYDESAEVRALFRLLVAFGLTETNEFPEHGLIKELSHSKQQPMFVLL
jgi:hypothetical protein